MLDPDPLNRLACRFCGLTLMALEVLTIQGCRLYNAVPVRKGKGRRHLSADSDPRSFVGALMELLPPRRLTGESGRRTRGNSSPATFLPQSRALTDDQLLEHVGPGADYYWYEFSVEAERPSAVPQVPARYPILFGRFVLGVSSDGTAHVVELMGQNLSPDSRDAMVSTNDPLHLSPAVMPPTADGPPADLVINRGPLPGGMDSRVMLDEPDEPRKDFSHAMIYTLMDELVHPVLVRAASGSAYSTGVPPFAVSCTSVYSPGARVVMTASVPQW